jgi:hypothetical protein
LIKKVNGKLPEAFKNQAGDMLNLGAVIIKTINAAYGMKWMNGDLRNNKPLILNSFEEFLNNKELSLKNI